ncbi:bestrophin family protein [Emticicia sp. SJ17W-69]|uniref:bestrophin family protein n=1 Tax=Emticicia sp. SJ17W-69 TaxID=3421657 RepID=UPI003EBCE2DA
MYINKNIKVKFLLQTSGMHLVWIVSWISSVYFLYYYFNFKYIAIPWTTVGVIGTAVSFYIGFKNNQAYDRLWEARKIWGGFTNTSRMLATSLRAFSMPWNSENTIAQGEIQNNIKTILNRHIAYLYTLRHQLLIPTPWEHISQKSRVGTVNRTRMNKYGIGSLEDNLTENIIINHLNETEQNNLHTYKNVATYLIDCQSQHLSKLRLENIIDDFRHIELQKLLNDLLDSQGRVERIKNFPLPRQYGNASFIFVSIFIFLLPFGLVAEFSNISNYLFIPVVSLIAWVFLIMELVGDYSENPFEGLGNDIPMLSICRNIEIDLKQLINDTNIPKPIQAVDGVLM